MSSYIPPFEPAKSTTITQKRSVGAVNAMVYCPRLSRFMRSFYLASGLLLPLILSSQGSGVVIVEDERRDLQSSSSSSFDCVDPRNPSLTSIVRKGDPTTVCLFVGPDGDWNDNISYKRFSLTLTADEFTSYEIPGSFSALKAQSGATHIFAASQSSLSFLRRYVDSPLQRIYPFLTAIIEVDKGSVIGITWDDACGFCERSECQLNTYNFDGSLASAEQAKQPVEGCYLTREQCLGFAASGSKICDLKLFVVWTGTDVDGKALLSSDSRFSMFPPNRIQESVTSAYEKMIEQLKNIKDNIQDTVTGQR